MILYVIEDQFEVEPGIPKKSDIALEVLFINVRARFDYTDLRKCSETKGIYVNKCFNKQKGNYDKVDFFSINNTIKDMP